MYNTKAHLLIAIDCKPAPAIDELPLQWFYGNGVQLDMTHKPEGNPITPEDIGQGITTH